MLCKTCEYQEGCEAKTTEECEAKKQTQKETRSKEDLEFDIAVDTRGLLHEIRLQQTRRANALEAILAEIKKPIVVSNPQKS